MPPSTDFVRPSPSPLFLAAFGSGPFKYSVHFISSLPNEVTTFFPHFTYRMLNGSANRQTAYAGRYSQIASMMRFEGSRGHSLPSESTTSLPLYTCRENKLTGILHCTGRNTSLHLGTAHGTVYSQLPFFVGDFTLL